MSLHPPQPMLDPAPRRQRRRIVAPTHTTWMPAMARGIVYIRAFLRNSMPTSAGPRRQYRDHTYPSLFFAPALIPTPRWREPEWSETSSSDDTYTEID